MTAMTKARRHGLGKRGATLSTIHEIERILRTAHGPLSLNEIKRRMRAKVVRHETVRAAVEEFMRLGFVSWGSEGVVWNVEPHPQPSRRGSNRRVPDIEDLAGALAEFGTVEEWNRDLDASRGVED